MQRGGNKDKVITVTKKDECDAMIVDGFFTMTLACGTDEGFSVMNTKTKKNKKC